MRTLITSLILTLTLSLSAGEPLKQDDKYCGKMVDGKMTVVHNGETVTVETKLGDGTILKPDASVVHPDGRTEVLKDGECIGEDGKPREIQKQTPRKS